VTGILLRGGDEDTETQEGGPGEDTGRQPPASQGGKPHEKPTSNNLILDLQPPEL